MKILLDTHCWLWMKAAPERFSGEALKLLEDTSNDIYLSAVSAWEIAIKYALGKLPLPMSPREYMLSRMEGSDIKALPITHAHALQVAELPKHHRDPFDRLLIVQANMENLALLSADAKFSDYDVEMILAA